MYDLYQILPLCGMPFSKIDIWLFPSYYVGLSLQVITSEKTFLTTLPSHSVRHVLFLSLPALFPFILWTVCSLSPSLSLELKFYGSDDFVDQVHYCFPVSSICQANGRFSIKADGMKEWVNEWVIHYRYILPVLKSWFARERYLVLLFCHSYCYTTGFPQTGGLRLEPRGALGRDCSDEGQSLAMRELGRQWVGLQPQKCQPYRCWGLRERIAWWRKPRCCFPCFYSTRHGGWHKVGPQRWLSHNYWGQGVKSRSFFV